MNNESVRDSVFRYCPEDPAAFLSMEFLAPKTQTIMDMYRKHEAELMIESITKNCETTKEKAIKVLQNFRNDKTFAKAAIFFFTKEFLGNEGPTRLKQAVFMFGYTLLLLIILLVSGITRLTIMMFLVFILTMISFAWVGFQSSDTKSVKLNIMMNTKSSNHLITNVLKMIENHSFEQLANQAYDQNLHCYECMIVMQP